MFIKNECSDIAHTEKYDGIFSPTFVVDDFSGSFLHPSVFYIKDSRSAYIINAVLSNFWYGLNFNMLVSFEPITNIT